MPSRLTLGATAYRQRSARPVGPAVKLRAMQPNDFRSMCLAIPGAVESSHMGHPDFRLNGKIFASLSGREHELGMVKLTPLQQKVLLSGDLDVFHAASGAWGRQGCTMVRLKSAKKKSVKSAIALAAENVSATTADKPSRASPKKKKPSQSPADLTRIRKICQQWPDTKETITWGKPHFRFKGKIFAGLDDGVVGCKTEMAKAARLITLPGFSKAPYVGHKGWVSIDLKIVRDWKLIEELLHESYGLISGCEKPTKPRSGRNK
jgi:predicted DNA-binding protein (MmcQ/YjbR family)